MERRGGTVNACHQVKKPKEEACSARVQAYGGLEKVELETQEEWRLPGAGGRRAGEVFGVVKLLCLTQEWGLRNIVHFSEPVERAAPQMNLM